ncbi:hypothetical protein [Pontibacillus marinus]|uniref:Uncharacterized protein n=1 Tax=Pontibacillus marinus BH030004 = DSM 16465 TaxID=1385511 RepID=A0A0A5I7I4_9BACI|nr:hypothetical protein [Pontibacillus marinus]KGX91797.1 hypothetical protein N783_00700 [Pontibacillus marinus BH030004 = DSM 16465]
MIEENQLTLELACIQYFEGNQDASTTINNLSLRTGVTVDELSPVLEQLLKLSIIERIETRDGELYRYVQPRREQI